MKYLALGRISLSVSLTLSLGCLTARAAERIPSPGTAAFVVIPDFTAEAGSSGEPDGDPGRPLDETESALAAARLAADPRREAEALTERAKALVRLGRRREASEGWSEAEKVWARLGDVPRRIEALVGGSLVAADRDETLRLVQAAVETGMAAHDNPLTVAAALKAGAVVFEGRGDHLPGMRLFQASLDLHRKKRSESIEVAEHLDRIGNLLLFLGDLGTAEARHHEALRIWERLAPEGKDRAQSLLLLAAVERRLGRPEAVMQHTAEAADLLARSSPGSPLHLAALRTHALAIAETRDWTEARRRLLRVLSMATGPEFTGERIHVLEALAVVAEMRGDPVETRDYFGFALDLLSEDSPDSPRAANMLRARARALIRLQQQGEAQVAFTRALAILEKIAPGSPQVAHTLREMGEMAHGAKDREGAKALYTRALESYRRHQADSYEVALLLGRLGRIAFEEGEFPHAAVVLGEAEAMFEAHRYDAGAHAQVLISQGWLAERTGALEAADQRYQRAQQIIEGSGSDPTLIAQLEQARGVLASHRGQFEAAGRHLRKALELRERFSPDPLGLGTDLANLGGLYLQQKNFPEAVAWFERAWKMIRSELGTVDDTQTLSRLGAERQWIAGGLAEAYAHQQKATEALVVVEQGRARALAALLNDQRSLDATLPPDLSQLLARTLADRDRAQDELAQRSQELLRAEAGAARSSMDTRAQEQRERAAAAFERARQEFIVHRTAVSRLTAGGALGARFAGGGPEPEQIAAAIKRLPAGSLYLAYQGTGFGMLLIVVERGGVSGPGSTGDPKVSVFPLNLSVPQLVQQADRYLEAMSAASGEAVVLGRALSETLFPRAARKALGRAKRIVISPEGPLWSIPFAALPLPEGAGSQGYLGLTRSLTLASSLSLFDRGSRGAVPRGSQSRPDVLVVGDPVFDRTPHPQERLAIANGLRAFLFADGRPPAPLPGTRADALSVASAYGAKPLLGEAATEFAVRQRLPQAEVVHLATHGYLNPRWALASGVLLTEPAKAPGTVRPSPTVAPDPDGLRASGPSGASSRCGSENPRNDGALQAWEILAQLKLRADLVVLAACETGRGEFLRGEGLQGLTRSLHVAGARSVVASLWKVRDDSTRMLMERLHRGIRAGLSKDEALRLAMLEVSRRKGWAHPFYWAGFVLTGDRENRLFAPSAAAASGPPKGEPARPAVKTVPARGVPKAPGRSDARP